MSCLVEGKIPSAKSQFQVCRKNSHFEAELQNIIHKLLQDVKHKLLQIIKHKLLQNIKKIAPAVTLSDVEVFTSLPLFLTFHILK